MQHKIQMGQFLLMQLQNSAMLHHKLLNKTG